MDLQSNELRNSIMEEVILKNYKLLQFVENEMKQLNDKIAILNEENASLKKEIDFFKETNKNLFYDDIQDTNENTMIIGYDSIYKPILFNIEKAYLLHNFKKSTDLSDAFNYGQYIISVDIFKFLNKFNNFKTFSIRSKWEKFIDEKFNKIEFSCMYEYSIPIDDKSELGIIYNDYIKLHPRICGDKNESWFHKQNIKKLLNILDECNIKLIINGINCDEYLEYLVYNKRVVRLRDIINL